MVRIVSVSSENAFSSITKNETDERVESVSCRFWMQWMPPPTQCRLMVWQLQPMTMVFRSCLHWWNCSRVRHRRNTIWRPGSDSFPINNRVQHSPLISIKKKRKKRSEIICLCIWIWLVSFVCFYSFSGCNSDRRPYMCDMLSDYHFQYCCNSNSNRHCIDGMWYDELDKSENEKSKNYSISNCVRRLFLLSFLLTFALHPLLLPSDWQTSQFMSLLQVFVTPSSNSSTHPRNVRVPVNGRITT